MLVLILCLIVLGLAAAGCRLWSVSRSDSRPTAASPRPVRPPGCCGQHEVCERESLLAAMDKEVEYYDDEELDAYAGRPSDAYTPDETDAFRDVLYTMRPDEVAGWVRSLQRRGVNLPDGLKDEVLILVGERRGL